MTPESPKKAQIWTDMMEQPWILLPDLNNWPTASILALLAHLEGIVLERWEDQP